MVTPKFVWQKFREGCSLRMPCPQKYSDPLHRLLSALEEEFGCMVGSNVYLTPARSQGFAPHWDDIEAFLLQARTGGGLGRSSAWILRGRGGFGSLALVGGLVGKTGKGEALLAFA